MPLAVALGSVVLTIVGIAAVVDVRARRAGHRISPGRQMFRRTRETRRDLEAWERGSSGNMSSDISWMNRDAAPDGRNADRRDYGIA